MSRPANLGDNLYQTDELWAARQKQTAAGHPERAERHRDVPRRLRAALLPADLAHRRSAGRAHARVHACCREAARPARSRDLRRRSVQHDRGLHDVRPLHHPRHRRVRAACRVRQRQPHRSGPGHGRDQLRDGPRHARAATPTGGRTSRLESGSTARRLAGALGRRRTGRRDHEPDRQDQHRIEWQRPSPQRQDGDHRAVQARRKRRHPVPDHDRRPGHLRPSVHAVAAVDAARGQRPAALRLPRGQPCDPAVAQRRARGGSGARSRPHARRHPPAPARAGWQSASRWRWPRAGSRTWSGRSSGGRAGGAPPEGDQER